MNRKLLRPITIIAIAAAVLPLSFLAPFGAFAFCTDGVTRWGYTDTATLYPSTAFTTSWRTQISNAVAQWNGIANSNLSYLGPTYISTWNSQRFKLFIDDPVPYGWPDVPGYTNNYSEGAAGHTASYVILSPTYTWNSTGYMDQSTRQVDIWTVVVHELGHTAGLAHPYASNPNCGNVTQAELASVMYVDWTAKRVTQTDDHDGIAFLY